jgi:hypothetical protein
VRHTNFAATFCQEVTYKPGGLIAKWGLICQLDRKRVAICSSRRPATQRDPVLSESCLPRRAITSPQHDSAVPLSTLIEERPDPMSNRNQTMPRRERRWDLLAGHTGMFVWLCPCTILEKVSMIRHSVVGI